MSTWWEHAKCAGQPSAYWFPESQGRSSTYNTERARELCRGCPVIDECLQSALAAEAKTNGERYGIYGGTTPKERAAMHGPRKTGPKPTDRERLAELHAKGLESRVIAERLGISPETVRKHLNRLGLKSNRFVVPK